MNRSGVRSSPRVVFLAFLVVAASCGGKVVEIAGDGGSSNGGGGGGGGGGATCATACTKLQSEGCQDTSCVSGCQEVASMCSTAGHPEAFQALLDCIATTPVDCSRGQPDPSSCLSQVMGVSQECGVGHPAPPPPLVDASVVD